MTMQLPQSAFDVAEAHLLREARRARPQVQSRAWAGVITIIAHIVAVTVIVEGLRQANVFHAPDIVTVHIQPKQAQPEDVLPLPAPPMTPPHVITAPIPVIDIDQRPVSTNVAVAPPAPTVPAMPAPTTTALPATKAAVTWQGLLLARLEASKQYPQIAQSRRQQGVVMLHFIIDREGRVLSAEIRKSSGYPLLDQESLDMIQRAQPLPRPPAEIPGDPVDLVVPVEFSLNRPHKFSN
jgi:TonB family protein